MSTDLSSMEDYLTCVFLGMQLLVAAMMLCALIFYCNIKT
ncbi:putative membrane protein [Neorickettsia helminthoeca str. Oregon]|uniref:Putative membrane protein n=2 Tax=Neorickettsia helminthoeca TaxID=33994 RepID=X5HL54_9RICK|nr:putative membrane protein [Neorickettsia helminthoeca str. Oregon]